MMLEVVLSYLYIPSNMWQKQKINNELFSTQCLFDIPPVILKKTSPL